MVVLEMNLCWNTLPDIDDILENEIKEKHTWEESAIPATSIYFIVVPAKLPI